jgi:levanbiose-producing levanase
MTSEFRRRALLQGAGIGALALFAATAPGEAARAASLSRPGAPSAATAVTGTS